MPSTEPAALPEPFRPPELPDLVASVEMLRDQYSRTLRAARLLKSLLRVVERARRVEEGAHGRA
jgi:hypothetical protein